MKIQYKLSVNKLVVIHDGKPIYGFKLSKNQKPEFKGGQAAISKDHFLQTQLEYEGIAEFQRIN